MNYMKKNESIPKLFDLHLKKFHLDLDGIEAKMRLL